METHIESAAAQPEAPSGPPRRRFAFVRRHKALLTMFTMLLVPTLGLGGWVVYLNHQVAQIPRFEVDLDRPGRPARPAGEALTFLVVGVDTAQAGGSFQNTMRQETWPVGSFRGDVIMLVHLDADRSAGQVMSIPRDSWVPIPGHGTAKINAAFSYGGPELLARTVEDVSGAYIDHIVVLDFAGFEKASEIVDGVPVILTRPETLDGRRYGAGDQYLKGKAALDYVRQRYDLPRGDFDRVQRQQNFLRGFLDRLGDIDLGDPIEVTRLTGQVAQLAAVDADLTTGAIRSLAWSLRHLEGETTRFVTAPNHGVGRVGAASIVKLDVPGTRSLFRDILHGTLPERASDSSWDELPGRESVR